MKTFIGKPHSTLALVASAILVGCGGFGLGGTPNGDEPVEDRITEVRGTVDRVDTRDRVIIVDEGEASYRGRLRNADERFYLYYDDRTEVHHEGKTYRPADLEPGDEIAADVDNRGDRLLVYQIDVLYDVSGPRSDRYGDRHDDHDHDDGGDRDDDRYGDRYDDSYVELRGEIRYIDSRDRSLELERVRYSRDFTAGQRSGEIVTIDYDADTIVEYEGRRYRPENLERGDVVEVEARDTDRHLLAERIVVVESVRDRVDRYDR